MKLFRLLILGLMLMMLMGCRYDTLDKDLVLRTNSYILQKNEGTEKQFAPYISATGFLGNVLESMSVEGTMKTIATKKVDSYVFETDFQYGTLASVNDNYRVKVKASDGSKASFDVSFAISDTDTLGHLNLLQFDYDSSVIHVKCNMVENANYYGLCVGWEYYNLGYSRAYHEYYIRKASDLETVINGQQVIYFQHGFSLGNSPGIARARIAVVAYNETGSNGRLILESEFKTVEQGALHFSGDL